MFNIKDILRIRLQTKYFTYIHFERSYCWRKRRSRLIINRHERDPEDPSQKTLFWHYAFVNNFA